jgi:murein DD-endopeptidase MepM/ murein hydrolase activator NlpD
MIANSIGDRRRRLKTVGVGLAVTLLLALTLIAKTFFNMGRPTQGPIDQTYLWANTLLRNGNILYHHGVDFPVTTGTTVLAVADGKVVDLQEDLSNGDQSTPYGNFVVVQHEQRHWDRNNGQGGGRSYVYTMYLHLAYGSVIPIVGSNVTSGKPIALSDSTGRNVTGQHLHFQIVLHPQSYESLDFLEPGTRSRNPELWLSPLTSRATAIGKITDSNGNPVQNKIVCGLSKNGQEIPIRTYSFPWANPDDLLYENFGTTDVTPGTYHLYAYEYVANSGCGQTPLYRDLGNYTFTANRTTYIGLYPYWLPTLKPLLNSNWDIQTYVRNLAPSWRSAMNVTYFRGKYATQQWDSTANGQATILIDGETNESFNGLIVPSLDAAVLELQRFNGQPAGTTGISAFNGRGAAGWERAGATLYVPLVKDDWYGRRTQVFVTNTGSQSAAISFQFYDANGPVSGWITATVPPNERFELSPSNHQLSQGVYSAVIKNDVTNQPLAAVALEQNIASPFGAPALYNAYSEGHTILYAPLVKKKYGSNTSGITLQNTTNSLVNFQAHYFNMKGDEEVGTVPGTIQPFAPHVLYNPTPVPENHIGSVRITADGKIVGEVSEEHELGRDPRLIYNLSLQGSTNIYLPLWYDNYTAEGGNWASRVNIQNVSSYTYNDITITWRSLNGTVQYSETITLSSNETRTIFDPQQLTNFRGSVWIHSNNGQPIVAVSDIQNWAASSNVDSALSFTGSNR